MAISQDGVVIDFIEKDTNLNHSQTGMPLCKEILDKNNLTLNDIDGFAVVVGPGSFTGLRIGIAIAKGFAFSLNKPLYGISSLKCVAKAESKEGKICALIKAREDDYFYGLFDGKNQEIFEADAPSSDSKGNIQEKYRDLDVVFSEAPVRANSCAEIAYNCYLNGENGDVHRVSPLYLKLSQAERMKLESEK